MATVLGMNQYGKAETRVVRIHRDTPVHEIRDLNVSTSLRGDFERAHTIGDQSMVMPTDSQKNTAFAYAKVHGVDSIEDYAIALGKRLLKATPAARQVQVRVQEYAWDRIGAHSFVRRGGGLRTCVVTVTRGDARDEWDTRVVTGVEDLVVLNSTGSEFKGFLKEEYTTLPEADDRILATSLVAKWRHTGTDVDWNASYEAAITTLLEAFAGTYSRALQETLYVMGAALLDSQDALAEVRFSAPNKHHFLVDFSDFQVDGLTNDGEVFIAADRPYGLIEAQVIRDDAPTAGDAWLAEPGFC
ncbi:factor-independent urate hydroxylase [Actinomadura viridis]|uniref:factor-independent urate hydroxylase n=1 Tax=Actinomadura viridis TaxID=58110 RepID=UPI0036949626